MNRILIAALVSTMISPVLMPQEQCEDIQARYSKRITAQNYTWGYNPAWETLPRYQNDEEITEEDVLQR